MSKLKHHKNKAGSPDAAVSDIEPMSGWQIINFKSLKEYRDLFYFLVWRGIKVLYAQTVLWILWAILQPMVQIVIFKLILVKIVKISTEGIPYFIFSSARRFNTCFCYDEF